jgi:hypothetical protein
MADERWLRKCLGANLEQLVVLHLEGGPPSETVYHTAEIWLRVMKSWPIVWNEALDTPRLDAAFLALASQSQRWPSPSQLRTLLPARAYPEAALSAPDYPPEKAAANLRKIKTMIQEALAK